MYNILVFTIAWLLLVGLASFCCLTHKEVRHSSNLPFSATTKTSMPALDIPHNMVPVAIISRYHTFISKLYTCRIKPGYVCMIRSSCGEYGHSALHINMPLVVLCLIVFYSFK